MQWRGGRSAWVGSGNDPPGPEMIREQGETSSIRPPRGTHDALSQPRVHRRRPRPRALDVLSRQGREDMLDLIWAAWFASRPERTKELLVRALDDGPEAIAGVTTAAATLTLMRLRSAAAGRPGGHGDRGRAAGGRARAAGAAEAPTRARRERRRPQPGADPRPRRGGRPPAAPICRDDLGGHRLPCGTELDPDGTDVREVPAARGFCRAAMGSLGLPFDTYMERMRTWL